MCFIFPCIVQKATARVEKKALNMCHQSQNSFRGILFGIPQHQKGYLIYIPSTRKIFSLHDVVFDKIFYILLAYTPDPYSDALATQPEVSYIPYATSSHEKLAIL